MRSLPVAVLVALHVAGVGTAGADSDGRDHAVAGDAVGWSVAIERPRPGETLVTGALSQVVFAVRRQARGACRGAATGQHCPMSAEHGRAAVRAQIRVDGVPQWDEPIAHMGAAGCSLHAAALRTGPTARTVELALLSAEGVLATHSVRIWARGLPWPELKIHRLMLPHRVPPDAEQCTIWRSCSMHAC